jgi:SanA protein
MIRKIVLKIRGFLIRITFKGWVKRLIIFSLVLLFWSNYRVYAVSKDHISSNLNDLPNTKTALLLGTSRLLKGGKQNWYFELRIRACVELYNSGKVKNILISGDNSHVEYNEPEDMKQELIKRGVPENKIYLDYAGFDTYDSVLRAWKIFGQTEFIVVSQRFHNQRAVYIARRNGLTAYGYNAPDVKKMSGIKTKIREYFACVKAFLDVLFNVDPYFLGKREYIGKVENFPSVE